MNRENGVWSDVQKFPKNISKVDSWESQPTVSSDGEKIIFYRLFSEREEVDDTDNFSNSWDVFNSCLN